MNTEQIRKDVDMAYQLIGRLSVSGDAIDVAAAARAVLRSALTALDTHEGEKGE